MSVVRVSDALRSVDEWVGYVLREADSSESLEHVPTSESIESPTFNIVVRGGWRSNPRPRSVASEVAGNVS